MNINLIVILLLGSLIGFYSWKSFSYKEGVVPSQLPWTQIDAGNKNRSFVNKTKDAGLYIERVRRAAITANPDAVFSYKGSTNGSLEYYFISGVLTEGRPAKDVCPPDQNVIWSDGDADDEICDNIDAGGAFGGYDAVDFGGAGGNDCAV